MTHRLFQLDLRHSYFSDGSFQGSQVLPDQATFEIIRNFSLSSRMNGGKFELYCSSTTPQTCISHLARVLGTTPLSFILTFNMVEFSLVTDLPLKWLGQLHIDSKTAQLRDSFSDSPFKITPTYCSRSAFKDNVIATISIHPSDLLPINENGHRYIVNFNARKAQWRYCLINRSQKKLNNPTISSSDGIEFENPERVLTAKGEKALSFSSGAYRFPMRQVPTERFNLVDSITQTRHSSNRRIEHVLISGLPSPNNDQVNIMKRDGSQHLRSTVYVYL